METIKILILGHSKIGKTVIKNKMIKNPIIYNSPTIGVEYDSFTKNYKGNIYNIYLWDCGGNKKFNTIIRSYFKSDIFYLICFDANDFDFKTPINFWLNQIKNKSNNKNILLIGIYSSFLDIYIKQDIISFINELELSFIFIDLLNQDDISGITTYIIDKKINDNNLDDDNSINTPLINKKKGTNCLNCIIL